MKKSSNNHPSKQTLGILFILLLTSLSACDDLTSKQETVPTTPTTDPTTNVVIKPRLITPIEYHQEFGDSTPHFLLDVRTPQEYASGHIRHAVNISIDSLPDRLTEIPKDIPIVVYCLNGNRSSTAARVLMSAGYQPVYDLGSLQDWIARGWPVE